MWLIYLVWISAAGALWSAYRLHLIIREITERTAGRGKGKGLEKPREIF
jgi:hypothetical protein